MAVLEFNDYKVVSMRYQRNKKYQKVEKSIKINPKFSSNIGVDGNDIDVTLGIKIGSLDDVTVPFEVECSIVGSFSYKPEEDETGIGLDQLVRTSAVAILFPYVRAIITMLTTSSNEFPSYILPTINVNRILNEQADQD